MMRALFSNNPDYFTSKEATRFSEVIMGPTFSFSACYIECYLI